jgi:hypothetical protein
MTEKDIQELLDKAKPAVIESLQKELAGSISYQVKQIASEEVVKFVREWIRDEVLPEIKRELVESKESFISVAVRTAPVIGEELSKHLTDTVKKSLENSYARGEILKKLFQGY